MPYPPRPHLKALPEFAGTARNGNPAADGVQGRLEALVVEQYRSGRSLREIAELVDRSQTAVRRVLDKHGVRRRESGASPVRPQASAMASPTSGKSYPLDHIETNFRDNI